MIRRSETREFDEIRSIINDAAQAYKGVIPADCWTEPYMTQAALSEEIARGVLFWGHEEDAVLNAVMGIQDVQDVTLIRHAYVRTADRSRGIGGRLLNHLLRLTERPVLIGTWADAIWAIRFYEKHGFHVVGAKEKDRLLRQYWKVSERQAEVSVVLASAK